MEMGEKDGEKDGGGPKRWRKGKGEKEEGKRRRWRRKGGGGWMVPAGSGWSFFFFCGHVDHHPVVQHRLFFKLKKEGGLTAVRLPLK